MLQLLAAVVAGRLRSSAQVETLSAGLRFRSDTVSFAAMLQHRARGSSPPQTEEAALLAVVLRVAAILPAEYVALYIKQSATAEAGLGGRGAGREADVMLLKADSDGAAGVERRGESGAAYVRALVTGSPVRLEGAGSAEAAGVPPSRRLGSSGCGLLASPIFVSGGGEVIGVLLMVNRRVARALSPVFSPAVDARDSESCSRSGQDGAVVYSCSYGIVSSSFTELDEALARDICAVLAAALGPPPPPPRSSSPTLRPNDRAARRRRSVSTSPTLGPTRPDVALADLL